MQTICSKCYRVKNDSGEWIDCDLNPSEWFSMFNINSTTAEVEYGICPECESARLLAVYNKAVEDELVECPWESYGPMESDYINEEWNN